MARIKDIGQLCLRLGVKETSNLTVRQLRKGPRREGFRAVRRQHGVNEGDGQAKPGFKRRDESAFLVVLAIATYTQRTKFVTDLIFFRYCYIKSVFCFFLFFLLLVVIYCYFFLFDL